MVTGTPKMITDGLVLYFDAANVKSYPGSGTNWVDLSPTAATASLLNGPVFGTRGNGSISFDSTNDYVATNHNETYQRLTLSAWVFPTASSNAVVGDMHVITKNWFYATSTNSWPAVLSISQNGITGSFSVNNGTAYFITQSVNGASVSGILTSSRWNHIAATYNGLFAAFYVNGILTATQSYSGSVNYSGSTVPWNIGRCVGFNGGGTGGTYYSGSIAIASIYNRGLSAEEVLQNFEATRERFGV